MPAETIVPDAKEYIGRILMTQKQFTIRKIMGIHQGLRWSFCGRHKKWYFKDAGQKLTPLGSKNPEQYSDERTNKRRVSKMAALEFIRQLRKDHH